MPMLMIIGWTGAEYGPGAREFLTTAMAGLCAGTALSGCLAALPQRAGEREWLFAYLSSVRQVASIRTGVLASASILSISDLSACEAVGLDEVVILQDTSDPGGAVESVRAYQKERPATTMGIRVWLDEAIGGAFQTQVCAWKHSTQLTGIDPSPFPIQVTGHNGTARRTDAKPLACEWLRSALTVTPDGMVVPCPAHMAKNGNGHTKLAHTATEVLARHGALVDTAGCSPVCRSCHRLARFVGADGIGSATDARPGVPQFAPNALQYHDSVSCDANSLAPPEREAAVAKFVARIRALGSEGCS